MIRSNKWDIGDNKSDSANTTFAIANGVYSIKSQSLKGINQRAYADATKTYVSSENIYIQVDVNPTNKNGASGISFRARSDNGKDSFYYFYVEDGKYTVSFLNQDEWQSPRPIDATTSDMIKVGQKNTLTVITQASKAYFYINDQFVASLDDLKLQNGEFGVAIDLGKGLTETFAFDNFEVRVPANN